MAGRQQMSVAIGLGALLAAAVCVRLLAGPDGLALPAEAVVWKLRLMRVGSGVVVGASLATSGVMLQALLRNPLAAPSVLGLTTGAGLGVSIAVYAGSLATGATALARAPVPAAVVGALGALAAVYLLAQRRGAIEPITLILVGVIVSSICAAGSMFVQHLMPDAGLALTSRWLLGALSDDASPSTLAAVGALAVASVALASWLGPMMDAATLSDDEAMSVGVSLAKLRGVLLVLSGILAAGATALAGPVAFVGLIAPHAARLLAGPSHRALTPLAAMTGATVIVLADTAVRLVDFGAGRMPIGVLTALLGGPAFLLILRKHWVQIRGERV